MSARITLPGGVAIELDDDAVDALVTQLAEVAGERGTINSATDWLRGADAAADHLGCKPRRIFDLVSREAIPFQRDGTRLVFSRSELDEWARSQ